jgi:hypothetical protein
VLKGRDEDGSELAHPGRDWAMSSPRTNRLLSMSTATLEIRLSFLPRGGRSVPARVDRCRQRLPLLPKRYKTVASDRGCALLEIV